MARDLVNSFCKGEGKRFNETVCEYYDPETGECTLLRDFPLQEIFEKGRCTPFEILKRSLAKHLQKYRDRIDPSEHINPIAFELAERLNTKRLTQGFQLYVLQGYINRTVYCGVIEMLRREDPLVKRQCGSCKHLSVSRPYTCQRDTVNGIEGKEPNSYYGTIRKFTDRACKKGFEPLEITSLETVPEIPGPLNVSHQEHTGILLADMFTLLSKRPDMAKDARIRKRYERQYLIFCQLIELLQQGDTSQEAIRKIAATLDVSEKTIHREIFEIKEFFKLEDVL